MLPLMLTGTEGEVVAEGFLDRITDIVPTLLSLATNCFEAMTANDLTLTFLGVTFIGVGFGVLGMMLRTARHQ